MILAQHEDRADGDREGFFERRVVVVALPARGGRVERVDLHDAHAGRAQGFDFAAALRGDLLGAGAGVFGGVGHHLDFRLTGLRVDKLNPLGNEGDALFDQFGAFAAEARRGLDVGRAHLERLD